MNHVYIICFFIPLFACFLQTTAIVELSLIKNIYFLYFHPLFLCQFIFSRLCPMYDSVEAQGGLALILLKPVWPRKLYFKNLNLLLITCIKNTLQKGMKGEYALFIIHNAVK